MIARIAGPIVRKAVGLSGLTAAGQVTFLLALPILSRMFDPGDFGVFTIYLSIVNICGPIVGLKFESALFAARSREDARLTLFVSIGTMLAMSMVAIVLIHVVGGRAHMDSTTGLLAPVGILLAGSWALTSAWAIRVDAIHTLSVARFLQPALMTALQLAAGLLRFDGEALIVAHIVSHAVYTGFIARRTITLADLRALHPPPWRRAFERARDQRRFPLYIMPAYVASLMVANLPPILLGSMFGATIAGQVGVAYRIVSAPLSIVALPLGNVLTSEASRNPALPRIRALARKVLLASLVLVSAPLLLFAVLAPALAAQIFDPRWAETGEIAAAFAIFAAAQALSIPLAELTSIYHMQFRRFAIEMATTLLVLGPIVFGYIYNWTALETIWAMSFGGGIGALIGVATIWFATLHPAKGNAGDA